MNPQHSLSVQSQRSAARRSLTINKIKETLSAIPIISKNKTMISKKLQLNHPTIFGDKQFSSDSFSADADLQTQIKATFNHIEIFTEKYEMLQKIGEGSNGLVRKCLKKKNGKIYAVKSIMMDDQNIIELKNNFLAVKGLKHPNVVQYKALYIDLKKHLCYLVMEYITYPSLNHAKIADEEELKQIMRELLSTLSFIHKKFIAHRDIKLENILYDQNQRKIKIIDFGICKRFKKRSKKLDMMTITGTLYYRAPEMFAGGGYSEKVDVWAAGILLYRLIAGKTPFQSEYHSKTIKSILEGVPKFENSIWQHYSMFVRSLLTRMIKKNPTERLTAEECLRDLWFYSLQSTNGLMHRGSYHEISHMHEDFEFEEDKRALRSPLNSVGLMEIKQYVKKINGEEYHCMDSDDDRKTRTELKEMEPFVLN